jgi:peptidoglycan/xylan/chitin deacetylase (PgdA/CDA1 family)
MSTTTSTRSYREATVRLLLALSAVAALTGLGPLPSRSAEADPCPPPPRTVLEAVPAHYPRAVALTFDDGPAPRWTPQVLDVLARLGVRATFFVNGNNVDAYPWLARRIVAEGHVIGNHTYSHPDLRRLSASAQAAEIDRTTQAILAATGVRPCLFRGPYGTHHGSITKELVWSRGMAIAGWTHDTQDYRTPSGWSPSFQDALVSRATVPFHTHPMVLMHDGPNGAYRGNTVAAVERIVRSYAERGYAFVSPTGHLISPSAIQQHYAVLGGPVGVLGAPVSGEHGTTDGVGRYQHFSRGSIFWSPATGARAVYGAIHATWLRLGADRGHLRYPTTDEHPTADGRGRYNHFQTGSIFYSPTTGAREVRGAIHATWLRLGADRGHLGYPTTDERPTADGRGRYNDFTGGSVVWWSGGGAVPLSTPFVVAWREEGGETGRLGYPLRPSYPIDGGEAVDFQGGTLVLDSSGRVEVRPTAGQG